MPPMVPVSVIHVDGVEIPKPRGFKEVLPALGVATIASFGGFLFGFDSGVISGILEMEKFKEDYGNYYDYNIPGNLISSSNPPKPGWSISTSDRSLIVSILSVGTFFGALSAAPMADLMGRRVALQIAILIFVGGVILQCASTAVPLYAIGRLIAGLGVGAISLTVPLYQSEVSPAWIRGSLVSCYQWMITIGLLIASIVTNSTQNRKDKGSYIIPIAVQFMFALIISTGLLFLPDSPRWFVKRGQDEKAAMVIAKLNSLTVEAPYVQAELKAIKMDLEKEKKEGGGNYIDLFKKGDYKVSTRVIVGMASQALQQLTGINFIFYYGVTFFKMTGAKNPFVFAIISNVVNVVSTIPGMYMMERLGRRKLFIGGAIWMFIAQIIVASVGTAYDVSNRPAQAAAVAFVCIYIAGFAATWGPSTWVFCAEIFPLNVRAKALSLSTASNWIWNWAIGYATPYLVDSGPGRAGLGPRVYFIWAGGCLICIFFSYFFIVETRGLTLEEVNDVYINSTPINSTKYNSEIKARRTESEMITNKVSNTNDENDFDLENGHGKHEKQKEVEEEEIETPKIEENLKSSP